MYVGLKRYSFRQTQTSEKLISQDTTTALEAFVSMAFFHVFHRVTPYFPKISSPTRGIPGKPP